MKKLVLMFAVIAVVSIAFTSCKKDKKEEVKTEEAKEKMADNHLYQCPMNCEEGKSYTEEGNCPVCKMELKEKVVDMDGEAHTAECTCKSGGECKCAPGECKCMADSDGKEGEGHDKDDGADKDAA